MLKSIYGSVSAGREKCPFYVIFFLKVERSCDQTWWDRFYCSIDFGYLWLLGHQNTSRRTSEFFFPPEISTRNFFPFSCIIAHLGIQGEISRAPFNGKYGVLGAGKSWHRTWWCEQQQISSVAGRQPPGEEVGMVARIQPPTKMVVAQFRIFRGIAGTFLAPF